MQTTTAGIDFFALLEGSQLLLPEKLDEYRKQLADEPATTVANKLVKDELLTPFQAKVLLKGKQQSFFLTQKYKILDHLGTGGMGRVYLCEHMILQRLVAVKVLTTTPSAAGNATTGQGVVERFYREARAVAALDHRNIIRVFDVEQTRGAPFMVMEYVDGIDLDKYVTAHGPLDPNQAADYVRQAAEGLEHAHQAGLIHRDIKPSNLLLDRAGVVRLLDLGLARFLVDSRRNQGVTELFDANVILGTVDFMAPEQAIDSSQVDIRADIYSLGCTLYFLLTGKLVFGADAFAQKMLAHQMRDPVPIRTHRPEVPAGLEAVAKLMMAKKPENRYQTPGEVAAALREFAIPQPELPDTGRMPKVSARSFRLGLCPAPTAVRPTTLGDSTTTPAVAATANSTPRGGSNAASLGSGPDTLGVDSDTLIEDDEPEIEESERVQARSKSPMLLGAIGVLSILAIVIGVVLFWPPSEKPGAAVPKDSDGNPAVKRPDQVVPPVVVPKIVPPIAPDGVLNPSEAAKRLGERVTVQFKVASMGGKANLFLNSRTDFTAKDNFAVVLSVKMQTGKWDKSTTDAFVGQTIRATGLVKAYKDATQLEIADPKDLEIIEK